MKRLVKSILVTGVLIIGANGLMAGPASNDWVGRIFKAKLGIAPLADTHQRAEQANTV